MNYVRIGWSHKRYSILAWSTKVVRWKCDHSFSVISSTFILHLAFGHATRSVIVRNQTTIDKNFPIRGNAFFIIFKNSPKFEYRESVSTIYAKRKFDPYSSTSIWRKYLYEVSLIHKYTLIESFFLINFNVKSHKI